MEEYETKNVNIGGVAGVSFGAAKFGSENAISFIIWDNFQIYKALQYTTTDIV